MRKAYKYRIYPTRAQQTKLEKTLELCRWVYNETLATRKNAWENEQRSVSVYDTMRNLPVWKKERPELIGVYAQVLQQVCTRVDLAFRAFFRRVKAGEEPGYPRFKGRGRYRSITYTQGGFWLLENGRLRLSKIGDVKIVLHRPIVGTVKTLTLRRDKLGKWFACFSCIVEPDNLFSTTAVIGVDVGLTHFATLSTGERIENPRFFKREEKAVKRARSQRDKAKKRSARRKKLARRANHVEQRITNRRVDFAHKLSRRLVDKYQVIAFEDLDIPDMMDGNWKSMNRSISDVAWGRFMAFTTNKAGSAGRVVVRIDPRNTTQMCSGCGELVKKDLSVRVHDCPHCGLVLDRDHNAALNILALGLQCLRADLSATGRSCPTLVGAE